MHRSRTSIFFSVISTLIVAGFLTPREAAAVPMYAMGRVPASDTSTLLAVTPSPFSAAPIGSTSAARLAGLDFQPGTGKLFASSGANGPNANSLFTVNPNTGAATLVGPVGVTGGVADLAIDSGGTIFGHNFASLFTINPDTGLGTMVGALSSIIEGLAVDPTTNILYGLDPFAGDLYSINKLTASMILLGSFGAPSAGQFNGFGIDRSGNFFGSSGGTNGEIYALNLAGFTKSLLGDAFAGGVSDIAFEAVPEPASLGLLTLGGVALLRRRRAA